MDKSIEDLLREVDAGVGTLPAPSAPAPRKPARRKSRAARTSILLIAAAIAVAVIGALPFGSYALYPFALLVTMIHETGHALMTVVTGGSVAGIQVSPDLSGVTERSGGITALIAPAGYLGATLAGSAILLAPIRWSRLVLALLAAVPVAALLAFHPTNLFTTVWALAFAVALTLAAWRLPSRWAGVLQIFIGVEASLNATRDLLTLLLISSTNAHIQTDAVAESQALFLPATAWSIIWVACSIAVLVAVLVVVVRRDLKALTAR